MEGDYAAMEKLNGSENEKLEGRTIPSNLQCLGVRMF